MNSMTPAQEECFRKINSMLQEHFVASVLVVRGNVPQSEITRTQASWNGHPDTCLALHITGERWLMDAVAKKEDQ